MAEKRAGRGTNVPDSGSEAAPRQEPITIAPDEVECPKARLTAYVRKMEEACEKARERHIAPLRREAIERCVEVGQVCRQTGQ